ncbi:cell cycle checkpoint control protein RAD9B isoform X2 [Scophthalmus maximus]|uniref:cell cycle checkpoint control protein RAD9B isoform X2 n=1 Tax=Scophthalmus maximus TaxID=52904 RepID=UPI001FA8702F|nr:cell cycle checkpoint control protein RAD9B isoform X2 [Scophthalmus maximus]
MATMSCVLEGNRVKAFGKAIHALSRIGEELWLDPMVKGLALRSVNSAHSAYTCFLFSPMFFQHYSLGSGSEQGSATIKCKLLMKSVLPLFRGLNSIERNVERSQISISTPSDRVTIQFFCRHGITKTHNLHFQESEALQAEFASHLCPNVLKAPARLLGDMVMHFPVFQEEITLSMMPLSVSFRNYCEAGNDHMKMMYTEMSLHPDEFDYFQVGVDSDITFCLKELRGFLSFAESHSLPVSVHFGATGNPVRFYIKDMVLEATVVLATLMDSEKRGPSQPIGPPHPSSPRCADAAALPAVSYEADGSKPQDIPAVTELITSSQGSPIINPPALMQLLSPVDDPDRLSVSDEACPSATTTPASTMICSLLFRALSSEQDDDGCAARLPVLACHSDAEEDMEEDYRRSPSL